MYANSVWYATKPTFAPATWKIEITATTFCYLYNLLYLLHLSQYGFQPVSNFDTAVDGSEIPNNHLRCIPNLVNNWISTTFPSTGDCRSSEPSTASLPLAATHFAKNLGQLVMLSDWATGLGILLPLIIINLCFKGWSFDGNGSFP